MSTGLKALEDIGHTRLFCVRLYWQQRLRRQKYVLWTQIRRGATLRLPSVKCQKARFGLEKDYSSSPGDRNRLTGGSQSISKCAREIGRTVSQFLNVHGQVSQFLNVRLPRSGRMPMKSGRVPIYKAGPMTFRWRADGVAERVGIRSISIHHPSGLSVNL